MEENDPDEASEQRQVCVYNDTSLTTRAQIYTAVSDHCQNGVVARGGFSRVAERFLVSVPTVRRIWMRGQRSLQSGALNLSSDRKNCGRSRKYDREELKILFRACPKLAKCTQRDSAKALGISQRTFFRLTKYEKVFKPVSLAIRPTLTDTHRADRVDFISREINAEIEPNVFHYFFDRIHIDEKWFFELPKVQHCYAVADEDTARSSETSRSKSHLTKVMFLACVARPRFYNREPHNIGRNIDYNNKERWYWDGKVGCFPIVETAVTQRRSGNRPRGVEVLKPVSMTAEVYQRFILNNLLPAIAEKCPPEMKREAIFIQQDNATPHKVDEELFREKCLELDIDCYMYYQPAQSPDLNVCDLCFFPSLQSYFFKSNINHRTVEGIIAAVADCFEKYHPKNLNRAFLSLMMNMNCILQANGGNQYVMPHLGKDRLESTNTLPEVLEVIMRDNNNAEDEDNNEESSNDEEGENNSNNEDGENNSNNEDEEEIEDKETSNGEIGSNTNDEEATCSKAEGKGSKNDDNAPMETDEDTSARFFVIRKDGSGLEESEMSDSNVWDEENDDEEMNEREGTWTIHAYHHAGKDTTNDNDASPPVAYCDSKGIDAMMEMYKDKLVDF
jgi:hypothetical protein